MLPFSSQIHASSLVVSISARICALTIRHVPSNQRNRLHLIGFQKNHDHQGRSILTHLIVGRSHSAGATTVESNKKYLAETLGFDDDKMNQVGPTKTGGNILTRDRGVLEGRVNWFQRRFQFNDEEIKKITQRQPNILKNKTETIELKIEKLQRRLRFDEIALRKIILTHPGIFGYSIEDSLEPKFAWLQKRLGLDDAALGKMIQRLPGILGYSIPDKMERTLDWLQERLRFDGDEDGLSNFVQRYPALFGYSVENNLKPTLQFYIEALGDESKVLVNVKQYPDLFGYSLEKRLKPRLKQARDAGMTIDAACLVRIGKHTEKQWQSQLAEAKKLRGKSDA